MLKKQQRIAAASPKTVLGSPMANADLIADSIKRASGLDVDFIVFPELALAGASLGSLLSHPHMLDLSGRALESICRATENLSITAAVGYPCEINGSVRSAVALINRGSVLATSFSDCAEAPFGFIPSVGVSLVKAPLHLSAQYKRSIRQRAVIQQAERTRWQRNPHPFLFKCNRAQ